MNKHNFLLILLINAVVMNSSLASTTLKVLHYNIKELDSVKISEGNSKQLIAVKQIISKHKFDILSLNEIQYDLKDVPTGQFKTNGENISKLIDILQLSGVKSTSFNPANTGKDALTKQDGTYYTKSNTNEARDHADQLNFGTMPGQYSSAAMSLKKFVDEKVFSNLKWKDFNPHADFSKFRTAKGDKFPEDMLLFDKNFSDISIKVSNKLVHIILLHTVPSFHFGNMKSINDFRNAEQLRFLEWYTTGITDFPVKLETISPLSEGSNFIAMGDLNVSHLDHNSEGSKVINSILNKTTPWIEKEKMNFTNEADGYSPNPRRLMLDYMFASKNIKAVNGKIIHPSFTRKELGCEEHKSKKLALSQTIQEYTKNHQTCRVQIDQEYVDFKTASDHYPIYGEFILQ